MRVILKIIPKLISEPIDPASYTSGQKTSRIKAGATALMLPTPNLIDNLHCTTGSNQLVSHARCVTVTVTCHSCVCDCVWLSVKTRSRARVRACARRRRRRARVDGAARRRSDRSAAPTATDVDVRGNGLEQITVSYKPTAV